MKIIYYPDLDSRFAAWFVKQAHKSILLKEKDFLEVTPGAPWNLESIAPAETVVLAGATPPDENTFRSLLKITPEVIWFSSRRDDINRFPQPEFNGLQGSRFTTLSAAAQVAKHFILNPSSFGMNWIDRISQGDPTNQTVWFNLGAEIRDTRPFADTQNFFKHISLGNNAIIEEVIQQGHTIALYRDALTAKGLVICAYTKPSPVQEYTISADLSVDGKKKVQPNHGASTVESE